MNSDTITPEFLYNSLLLRISVDQRLIGGPPRMSGADSTTEVTPTGRYEDHSLGVAEAGERRPEQRQRGPRREPDQRLAGRLELRGSRSRSTYSVDDGPQPVICTTTGSSPVSAK